ncbi:MAG: CinA family protein [Promethearchaeota archaeon]
MLEEDIARLFSDGVALAETVGTILLDQQLTIAVAESATGGLIGHFLTEIPGSSQYFLGGIIAYANTVKQNLLGVSTEVIEHFGAVSEEVVTKLADNVRQRLDADIGLATSGIAGPAGATPKKPVGLVFIAIALPRRRPIINQYKFEGNRSENKIHFAIAALELLLGILHEKT